MKGFKEWVEDNDELIKDEVEKIVDSFDFGLEFKGYYIEGNEYSIYTVAKPFWNTLKAYRQDNPSSQMEHIRYFFDCKNPYLQFTITIHISKTFDDGFGVNLVLEGRNFDKRLNSEDFSETDLAPLYDLIIKRLEDESKY
tara:strand:+ start:966 stop:1385 length:420 start_codon:yes stop_codon:yes gene_type:complete